MKQQSGFTLIELIAVIVILGILAAVAVPRYIDLSTAAESATLRSVANSLNSASAMNHANNIADDAGLETAEAPTAIASCDDVKGLLEQTLSTDYTLSYAGSTSFDTTEGAANACEVSKTGLSEAASFTAFAVSN